MQQLRQNTRYIISMYTSIPGLVMAATGLCMAIYGGIHILFVLWLYDAIQSTYPALATPLAELAWFLPCLVLICALPAITRYYQRSVGQLATSKQVQNRFLAEMILTYLAYLLCADHIDIAHHSPISTALLMVAAFLIVHWWLLARTQPHFLVFAGIVAILSCIPLIEANVLHWLYMYPQPDWYTSNTNICAGIVLTLTGLLSHQQMMHTLKRLRKKWETPI